MVGMLEMPERQSYIHGLSVNRLAISISNYLCRNPLSFEMMMDDGCDQTLRKTLIAVLKAFVLVLD